MLTLFGIVLLVAGAILTFAVERQVDGVDVRLAGWILMAGGGASLILAMLRAAGHRAASRPPDSLVVEHVVADAADDAADDPAHRGTSDARADDRADDRRGPTEVRCSA